MSKSSKDDGVWRPDPTKKSIDVRDEEGMIHALRVQKEMEPVWKEIYERRKAISDSNARYNSEKSATISAKKGATEKKSVDINATLAEIDAMLAAANSVQNGSSHSHINGGDAGLKEESKTYDKKKPAGESFSHTADIINKLMDISTGKNITK